MVLDLVEQREQCLVAFNFTHEAEAMTEIAKKRGLTFAVIDGRTPAAMRNQIVEDFQAGVIKVVFAHPQSAGHGLTLTAATTTIWASPTYNAEHYEQFNRRFYRAGQKKRTETIRIAANDTIELSVYDRLENKRLKLHNVLDLLKQFNDARAVA
jgi:SNF2 family DNA or RNA helicase